MSGAYYNEHDRKAAAWLRELMAQGLIAKGEVDERDIQAVRGPARMGRLRGYGNAIVPQVAAEFVRACFEG
jgi:hypothetical protein